MAIGCRDVADRVTAYLDGDLDATVASALRGHLRGCAPCRALVEDHARIAGVLAALPPGDPPAPVWQGVLARLAEAEQADAQRPGWSLALAGLRHRLRAHLVPALALAAAATVAVVWTVRRQTAAHVAVAWRTPSAPPVSPTPDPAPATRHAAPAVDRRDVTAALAAEADRIDRMYASTVQELLEDVAEDEGAWPPARRRAFDAELRRLQGAVDATPAAVAPGAGAGDPFDAAEEATARRERRERAWQRVVAYLQRAAVGELEEARR